MIKYDLRSSSLRAEVISDKDNWYKVEVERSTDWKHIGKLLPAKISIHGYGSVDPEIALDYSAVLKTAYSVAVMFNSPVYKFTVAYVTPKTKEKATEELLANDAYQIELFLKDHGITEFAIVAKPKFC